MLQNLLSKFKLTLFSGSKRRHHLIKELGLDINIVIPHDISEEYSKELLNNEIAIHLAEKKSLAYPTPLESNEILITADTIVWCKGRVLGKPKDREEAMEMLNLLSNAKHEVYTGVTLRSCSQTFSFYGMSSVYFRKLEEQEISYYIDTFSPYDKAGGYGVQEWIGYAGVSRIEGSFFNVMGLPTQLLYVKLREFIEKETL